MSQLVLLVLVSGIILVAFGLGVLEFQQWAEDWVYNRHKED